MKGHCPNCNRQPVSNALAASISEPASHGSWLGQAWAMAVCQGPWEGLGWQRSLEQAKIQEEQNQRQFLRSPVLRPLLTPASSGAWPSLDLSWPSCKKGQGLLSQAEFLLSCWVAVPRAQSLGSQVPHWPK